jgi:hypothetical protein
MYPARSPGGRGLDPRPGAPPQGPSADGPPGHRRAAAAGPQGPAPGGAAGRAAPIHDSGLADRRSQRTSQAAPYRTAVWQRLVNEEGAVVAESTVRAVVAALKRELESGTVLVTVPKVHPPGDEAEVDFGEASVWICRGSHPGRDLPPAPVPLGQGGPCRLRLRGPGGAPRGPRARVRPARRGARSDPL